MVDSELRGRRLRGSAATGEEAQVRAPKFDVATTTSTKEAACAPTSTPSSAHFTSGWTICCPRELVPAASRYLGEDPSFLGEDPSFPE
jgi:hypothetical protein